MNILKYLKMQNILLKNKSLLKEISLDNIDINQLQNWLYIDEKGRLVGKFNLLVQYAIYNHLECLEIPNKIEILEIDDEELYYENIIYFPKSFLGFSYNNELHENKCEYKAKNLICKKLSFKKCKNLNKVETYAFSELDLDILELPDGIEIEKYAFVNSRIDMLILNGINILDTGSLVQLDTNNLSDIRVLPDGKIEEDSCGKFVKYLYLPVNKSIYNKEFQEFMNVCRKYICKGHRVKFTKEERLACIEFFTYYLDNPNLMSEKDLKNQELPLVDMDIQIDLDKIKINTHGLLLSIYNYIFNHHCEIEKENYLKQFLLCVSKIFWISDDKNIEHRVYLYNSELSNNKYELVYSNIVTNKGKITLFLDTTYMNEFNMKFKGEKNDK